MMLSPLYIVSVSQLCFSPSAAFEPMYRQTERRDAAGAREELERSLERLHTDYLDLYQMHRIPAALPRGIGQTAVHNGHPVRTDELDGSRAASSPIHLSSP
jgi:hypothetical protein